MTCFAAQEVTSPAAILPVSLLKIAASRSYDELYGSARAASRAVGSSGAAGRSRSEIYFSGDSFGSVLKLHTQANVYMRHIRLPLSGRPLWESENSHECRSIRSYRHWPQG